MVWGTIAAAGLGIISGVVKGNSQRQQADAANSAQKKRIKAQYERDQKEWELNYLESLSDYEWSVAQVEAQRYQDAVRKQNYEDEQQRIIDSALLNLELNTEALRDQYVESEELRRLQVDMELEQNLTAQGLEFDSTLSELAYRSEEARLNRRQTVQNLRANAVNDLGQIGLDALRSQISIDQRAQESTLNTMEAVAGYMNSIKNQGLNAQRLLSQTQDQGKDIQEQIVIDEQLDTIQRDAQQITAILEGADTRSSSVARGGGSNSSRRVAMDSMKEFGRSFSQMKVEQQRRRQKLGVYNSRTAGETAAQFAQIANSIASDRDKLAASKTRYTLDQTGLQNESAMVEQQRKQRTNATLLTTTLGINQARQTNRLQQSRFATLGMEAQKSYDFNTNNLLNEYNKLTLPTFDLAARAGEREYAALVNNTLNTVQGASVPYQSAIIFDPLEPIAGLKPEKGKMTPVAKPSWGSILTGAFIQGAQGALGMSYTKPDGTTGWR